MKRGEEIKSVWPQESYTNILNHHIVRDIQSFKQSSATGELMNWSSAKQWPQLVNCMKICCPQIHFSSKSFFNLKKKRPNISVYTLLRKVHVIWMPFSPPQKYIFSSSYNSILINLTASLLLKKQTMHLYQVWLSFIAFCRDLVWMWFCLGPL